MTVSSRIAVMDHGRIVQVATPTEIYEFPNSRYVADFIGNVNIFEGRVASDGAEGIEIETKDTGCRVQAAHGLDVPLGATVWVAIRPEKLDISREPPAATDRNCMVGEVWDIGYLGNQSIFHVKLDGERMVTATQANRERAVSRQITWEDRVYLTWEPHASVVLSA